MAEEKLLLNSDCQLIIENYTVGNIVHNGEKIDIKKDSANRHYCDLTTDGLYELVVDGESEPRKSIFSICKLRDCLLRKERNYINNFLNTCYGNTGCSKNSNSNIADFLLVSIFVLEQLICAGNYDDATTILEIITNNGCGLCTENNNLQINDCGCGKTNGITKN